MSALEDSEWSTVRVDGDDLHDVPGHIDDLSAASQVRSCASSLAWKRRCEAEACRSA